MTTFNNTIENFNGQIILVNKFDNKLEAKKDARKLKKNYELIRHAGHIVNYKTGNELFKNY